MLLLTSTLGTGHWAAALAIETELLRRLPHTQVQIVDFWSLMDAQVAQAMRHAYLRLVRDHAELYDRVYRLDQSDWREVLLPGRPAPPELTALSQHVVAGLGEEADPHARPSSGHDHLLDRLLFRRFCSTLPTEDGGAGVGQAMLRIALAKWFWTRLTRRLEAKLQQFQPDVVVATVVWAAALLAKVKERRRLSVPCIAVPTDFGVHAFWAQQAIDHFCVAHETVCELDRLAASRVRVTGIPLMPAFRRLPSTEQARHTLGLDRHRPVLLVPGGGLGLGVADTAARLLEATAGTQILALTGRNTAAAAALAPLAAQHPGRLQIHGWTDGMHTFLRAADLVIGKLGGLTLAETLACGRPLLATRSLGGQESLNRRFLEHHGIGWLLGENQLVPRVRQLLAEPPTLAGLQQRAAALGRGDGATRVVDLIEELTQPQAPQHTDRQAG